MLVWSGGTISHCLSRQIRNVWSSWWSWWKETGRASSVKVAGFVDSCEQTAKIQCEGTSSLPLSSWKRRWVGSFLTRGNPVFREEVCVKCQSANWEQRWWQSAAVTQAGRFFFFFFIFFFCGLKVFILSVTQCYLHRDRRRMRGFRVSSPRAGRPILIAADFHQRQKDAAEEVQLGFKPRTTRGTYCTSSSDVEVSSIHSLIFTHGNAQLLVIGFVGLCDYGNLQIHFTRCQNTNTHQFNQSESREKRSVCSSGCWCRCCSSGSIRESQSSVSSWGNYLTRC